MIRIIILTILLPACSLVSGVRHTEIVPIPIVVLPTPETAEPKKIITKPRRAARQPEAVSDTEPEPLPVNPLSDCQNIKGDTPKEAARMKLDCINKQLDQKNE